MIDILMNGDAPGRVTVLLAHGAGAAMDTPFMSAMAEGLAARGLRVARFEFAYMAARRAGGPKRPPPKVTLLEDEFRDAIAALSRQGPLVIGGKSMGGRIASMIAAEMEDAGTGVRGLVCLGYPFHGPGRPMNPDRLAHLENLKTPALICQGARDTLGNAEDVAGYALSPAISVHWLEDGDHGFKPRQASGLTEDGNWRSAIGAIVRFLGALG